VQIDWLTVGAQWINFLVLMWLLHRFLYQPIVQAMDRRQQRIEGSVADARQKIEDADRQVRDYQDKLKQLESQRQTLLEEAHEAANRERERLIALARQEAQALSGQWRHDFEREKTELQQQLQRQLSQLIAATAQKALQDLTGETLQRALFENFLERLKALPAAEKNLLRASAGGKLVLASSFELDETLCGRFAAAARELLAADPTVQFEALPESRLGLVLTSLNYTLEWRLERYFDELLAELDQSLGGARPHDTYAE